MEGGGESKRVQYGVDNLGRVKHTHEPKRCDKMQSVGRFELLKRLQTPNLAVLHLRVVCKKIFRVACWPQDC